MSFLFGFVLGDSNINIQPKKVLHSSLSGSGFGV